MRSVLPLSFIVGVFLLSSTAPAEAQRYRYMDSSGNIKFVDSIDDVPRQYRQQIVPPTPTPVLDARQKKELQRAKERELKERQRQIENKKRELERTRRALERDQKLQAIRSGPASKDPTKAQQPAAQQPASRQDQIEVIR